MATSKIDLLIFFINLFIGNAANINIKLIITYSKARSKEGMEQGAWSRERGA